MITTLTGENDVLRQEALHALTTDFVARHGDMGLERLDGEEVSFERMLESVQSLPFLASCKLVVLRAPGANKTFAEKFETFVASVAETNDVLLVEPKLDKRLSYYKQLKKLTDFREFARLDANGLARYLADYTVGQGGALSAADARLLIDRVGENQLLLKSEIDKLLAYNPKITRASIETLTERTPQNTIFDLLSAAFAGNARQALELYEKQRAFGDDPQKILPMIVWQLHLLALAKAAGSRSADTVAKEARLSPFTVRKSVDLARRISAARIKTLVSELRVLDTRLKREPINADEVVRYYLLSLSQGVIEDL